jgi:UDP-glucose 4-epimerase
MKKILITGGTGYVGGRLVAKLLATNEYEILIASRQAETIVQQIFPEKDVRVINPQLFEDEHYKLEHNLFAVIHLAAYNEIESIKHPAEAARFNIISSLKLLLKAIDAGTKRFIYFSTAHVYGSPLQGIITEETLPRPTHPYAITHKAFEDFVLAARDKGEIDGIVVRLSNSFGTPIHKNVNRWTLLINDLCKQAATSNELKLSSNGLQERDFITLTDVTEAVLHLLQMPAQLTQNGLFNLGGNYTSTVLDIAKLIQQRAKQVMNKHVDVIVPAMHNLSSNETIPLRFSSQKLADTGFVWEKNVAEEIDELLKFCKQAFAA